MGMIAEIEAGIGQFQSWELGHFFPRLDGFFQQAAVFTQRIVDITDKVILIAVLFVVIIITAVIVAEFFIQPPLEGLIAFKAKTLGSFHIYYAAITVPFTNGYKHFHS
jgi:hypothetical protein